MLRILVSVHFDGEAHGGIQGRFALSMRAPSCNVMDHVVPASILKDAQTVGAACSRQRNSAQVVLGRQMRRSKSGGTSPPQIRPSTLPVAKIII